MQHPPYPTRLPVPPRSHPAFDPCIDWPLAEFSRDSDRDDAAEHTEASDTRSAAPDVRRLRVLLVDDNEDAIQSLEKMLSLLGYEVAAATNGKDALALGNRLRPDIALLDLGMPEMNGYEVAQAIRRETWGTQTRLIALTGWGQPEDIRRSIAEGFEAHLVKPLKTFELLRLMGRPVP